MRKSLFLFACMLAATGTFAQASRQSTSFNSHISLGPVLGLGHSWVSNIPGDRGFKFSPALGIGLVYSRNEHLGFGAQLLVSHEGCNQELKGRNGETAEVTINPVYLRMPLHLIYFFGDYGDRVRPKIYAGPSFALRVDETQHYSDESMRPEGSLAHTDVFSRADAGLAAGIGANVRLSRLTWLNLDAGYYHGLVDVVDRPTGTSDYNANRNLRLNIGLMWGL